MDLQAHYDAMRAAAIERLAQGHAEVDALLDDPTDARRGLTVLARLPTAAASALAPTITDFKRFEPAQYYYPASDLHLTVLSLISCVPGFSLAEIEPVAYQQLVGEVLRAFGPFDVHFRGLTASGGAVLWQGFPAGDTLPRLRAALRVAFRQAGLRQTIDTRYHLQTAHATVLRFRTSPQPTRLLQLLAQHQAQPVATVRVEALELVFNDWYQRAANTVLLKKYLLQPTTS